MTEAAFHYPTDLLNSLLRTIPLLCRSKRDTILFFRAAGLPNELLADLEARVSADRQSVSKREIAEAALTRINEGGDKWLRQRREVLKRVVEFEEFTSCWPDDQLAAKGGVAEVRAAIDRKDAFTRMHQERDIEHRRQQAVRSGELLKVQERAERLEKVRFDLTSLFSELDAQRRGKALEGVLNELFAVEGISVREAFVVNEPSIGTVEQVDGVVDIDGELYLVEMKWLQEPLGVEGVTQHLSRLYHRGDARGLIVSASGFTDAAVSNVRKALTMKTVALVELREIVQALELHFAVGAMLREKVRAAIIDGNPLTYPGSVT